MQWRGYQRRPDHVTTTDFQSALSEEHHRPALRLALSKYPSLKGLSWIGAGKAAAKKNVITAVEVVARMLGNTAAICRKCYIHPTVINKYMDGKLAQTLRIKADSKISDHLHELKPEEAAVLSLLRGELDRRSRSQKKKIEAENEQRAK
jgi:hypothetical protein